MKPPKCVFPAPVYVAKFADNQVVRMSFWSPAGEPLDFERGRRLCKSWHRTVTGADHNMTGHVEWDGDDRAH